MTKKKWRPSASEALVVLGVDPGTLVTGYGVVARTGSQIQLLGCGSITNGKGSSMPMRLKHIHAELETVIAHYHPDELAIESAFYGRNAQAALKLGHARGVSILAAVERDIPAAEYSPREIKKAVVGNGAASKEQVQFMIKAMLRLTDTRMLHDTSDAIATALCHLHRLMTPSAKHRNWHSFITAYPEKVKQ